MQKAPPRRTRGRPPLEGGGQDARIEIRTSEERKARYERAAAGEGVGLSAWIKRKLDRASR